MKYFILLIILFLPIASEANYNFIYKKLSTDQGLSNSAVNTITQDRNGSIWIGTLDGLNRYDGYNFKIFRFNREENNSITGNRVYSLYYDKNKNDLWIGLFDGGLNKLDLNNQEITKYNKIDKDTGVMGKHLKNIYKDSKGNLWISTNGKGLDKLDVKTNKFKSYMYNPKDINSLPSNYVQMVFEDSKNNLWIALKGLDILTKYDYETDKFIKTDLKLKGNNLEWITENTKNNTLLIGTRNGALNIIDFKTNKVKNLYFRKDKKILLKESLIRTLFFEKESNLLWIGTEKGLFIYDTKKETVDTIKGLSHIHVRTIFKDNMGLIWIGTLSNGVIQINKNNLPLEYLTYQKFNKNSLIDNTVWNIFEDSRKNLWVSTTNGITIYDENNKFIKKYFHLEDDTNSMSESNASSILELEPNIFWIGTYGNGIEIFNKEKEVFKNINKGSQEIVGLTSNYISKIFKDKDGNIWIGTYDAGLNLYLESEKKFLAIKKIENDKYSLKSNQIRDIIEDNNKNLWIATYGGGLFLYKDKKFINYLKKYQNKTLAIDNSIYSIAYDKKNNFIWGASEGGYFIFDLNKNKFIEFNFLKQLNDKILLGVVIDNNNNIWYSSGKGVFWIDFKEKKVLLFDQKDGLLTSQFNENAYSIKKNGTVCFGSKKGALLFKTNNINIDKKQPKITLSSIKINNKEYNLKDKNISEIRKLELNYDDNLVTFQFSIIDYLDTSKNTYQYKIIGLNNNWSDFTSNNQLAFPILKSGKFKLIIRGKNSKQILSKNKIEINIIVNPPFYLKTSFIISSIFIILIIVLVIYKYRIASIKKLNKILVEKVKERTYELYQTSEKLKEMALSDSLTGLRNRYFFKVIIKNEIINFIKQKISALKLPKRKGDTNNNVMGFFMVDLDHFKMVNDKYGHDSGDMVLKQVAEIFRTTTRGSDTVIRWGGEEFLIILKDCDVNYLDTYCQKLITEINNYDFKVLSGEKIIQKTCSIGYVKYPLVNEEPDYINIEHAILIADLALYYAKENGRNRGVKLDLSNFKPDKENIPEYLETLEKSLENDFLKISKTTKI